MILSKAVPPLSPSFPKLLLNVPLGLVVGLFLGMNLAFLLEFFDRRVRSTEDLTGLGEIRVLGTLHKPTRSLRSRLPLRFPRLAARRRALPA
jgi:capsular polysaccharide biosynthesis protein